MHNVEWEYYHLLSQRESNLFRRIYLKQEAKLLKAYESQLQYANLIFSISPRDHQYLKHKFQQTHYIPAFHPNKNVQTKVGKGKYCLYHGNLSVPENHEAAQFLITKVFSQTNIPLIIAGANPKPELLNAIKPYPHISIQSNLPENQMNRLIQDAHIHTLPTFQPTGIKLKLLNALFQGRFCIVNPQMVQMTQLEPACIIAQNAKDFRQHINRLFQRPFDDNQIKKRNKILANHYSNQTNAKKVIDLIQSYSQNYQPNLAYHN